MTDLLTLTAAHESNVYSQCGEDGVIAAICETLGITAGAAVEFGAWDGKHYSNTGALRERGWNVCLIEGEADRYADLVKNTAGNPNVVAVHGWVKPSGDGSLDSILKKHFAKSIDVLSIDIDSDDYHVFEGLAARPRVIVIEFNPTIPPFIDRVNPIGASKGSSLAAMARLGAAKGYDLVHATLFNAFFVDSSRNGRLQTKTALEAFRWEMVRYVVSDFDGENWLANVNGHQQRILNPWDNLPAAIPVIYPPELLGFGAKAAERHAFLLKLQKK